MARETQYAGGKTQKKKKKKKKKKKVSLVFQQVTPVTEEEQ